MGDTEVKRFHRERAVIEGGYWARMLLLERGVWVVLLMHSDFDSGRVAMAMPTIARLAGISNLHRARMACQQLEQQGLLRTIHDGGGRYDVTVREMLAPKPLCPLPWDDATDLFNGIPETGTPDGPVSPEPGARNRAAGRAQTGTPGARNRAAGRAQTGTPRVPQSHTSHHSPPPQPQTGTPRVPVTPGRKNGQEEEEDSGLVRKLTERGIWLSSARELEAAGLTDAQADRTWKEVVNDKAVRERGKAYHRRLRKLVDVRA